MGRIKTKLIKRASKDFVKEHGSEFKEDFQSNKAVIENLADIQSKKMRNLITGYVTRLTKHRQQI